VYNESLGKELIKNRDESFFKDQTQIYIGCIIQKYYLAAGAWTENNMGRPWEGLPVKLKIKRFATN
jgi:hypothetical protein